MANHFCSACGCEVYADSPHVQPDGSWDGVTRPNALNARLVDDFEADGRSAQAIDGKAVW